MLSKDSSGMPFVRKLGSWPSVRWTRFLARSRHSEVDLSYRAVAANTGCLCLCVVYLTSQMQLDAKKMEADARSYFFGPFSRPLLSTAVIRTWLAKAVWPL